MNPPEPADRAVDRPLMDRPTLAASLIGGLLVLLCVGYFMWRALRG